MKLEKLSTKKFLCLIVCGALTVSAFLLFGLFWVTKNVWAVLYGGVLAVVLRKHLKISVKIQKTIDR